MNHSTLRWGMLHTAAEGHIGQRHHSLRTRLYMVHTTGGSVRKSSICVENKPTRPTAEPGVHTIGGGYCTTYRWGKKVVRATRCRSLLLPVASSASASAPEERTSLSRRELSTHSRLQNSIEIAPIPVLKAQVGLNDHDHYDIEEDVACDHDGADLGVRRVEPCRPWRRGAGRRR